MNTYERSSSHILGFCLNKKESPGKHVAKLTIEATSIPTSICCILLG